MNVEEAIKTALEYERKISEVYQKYANEFKSDVGAKIFKLLGKEEEDHVAYLEAKLTQWQNEGKVTFDGVDTVVPDKDTLKDNVKKVKQIAKEGTDHLQEEIGFFEKALEMEVETSNFYKEMVAKLPAENQPMFQRFVEIEEGHEAIVAAEIDNAKGLGYWFDFQEFDLEEA